MMNSYMKTHTKLAFALPIATVLLSACATTSYKVGAQTYKSHDEAMAAVANRDAEADSAISAGAHPLVDRKLLIVLPTASAISKVFEGFVLKTGKQYAQPGTAARAQDDLNAEGGAANFKSIAASVKKANIYREVELMEVDTTAQNIQPSQTQDVLSFYLGVDNPTSLTVYFMNAKTGKQIVAIDMGVPQAQRRQSLIDDVKAKALQ